MPDHVFGQRTSFFVEFLTILILHGQRHQSVSPQTLYRMKKMHFDVPFNTEVNKGDGGDVLFALGGGGSAFNFGLNIK